MESFPISRVYQAHIPTYPSGHWLFGFASKKYHPLKDLDETRWNMRGIPCRYYTTTLHKGAFYIPAYVEELLKHVEKNIETFLCCDREWEEAGTVLFGAPFDSTTSYRPGSRFGSAAIRRESYGIESYSPYQDKDLLDSAVFDSGDIELPFGDTALALSQIEERAAAILQAGKRPFLLGGEHLVTLGAFRAAFEKYPDIHILHFDAHADLRDDYLGVGLSHACVLRRCWELCGDGKIFQFGIRSGGPGGVPLGSFPREYPQVRPERPGNLPGAAGGHPGVLHPGPGRAGPQRVPRHRHAGAWRRFL